jgi:hypothetical protein
VAIFRACSNPEVASRINAAVEAYDRIMESIPHLPQTPEPLPMAHGALRRAILDVLHEAHGSLRACEVRLRVEQRLERPVSAHSVVVILGKGSRDPNVSVTKTSHGRYQIID